jgi:membrane protease YdiL (CAAX protease family)
VRWGLGDALLAFALATLGGVIGSTIAVVATNAKLVNGSIPETAPILAGAVVGQYGAWFAWIYAASRFKGIGSLRADFGFVVDIARDWSMVLLGFAFEIAAGIVLLPISHLVGHAPQQVVQDLDRSHGPKLAVLTATAVVVAPVIEELFFRGLLLRSIQARWSDSLALVASSILFGLAHFELLQLPALVMFGLVAGYCAQRTGRLGMSIWAHVGFNATTVAFLLLR